MPYNLVSNIEACYSNIPQLLYYSHIPTVVVALILGIFVFVNNRKNLSGKLLLLMSILFALWSVSDIVIWISPDSRLVMFFWSIVNLIEILVSMTTIYFAYTFINQKQPPLWAKILFGIILASFAIVISTRLNLYGFDVINCESKQGPLINYFYGIEIFNFFFLLVYLLKKIFTTTGDNRKQLVLFSLGVIFFLFSFSGTNLIGSFAALANPNSPDNWRILQYGLFGMPVFIAFLAYLIVRFKTFNVKLVGAQALVFAIIILIGSEFFFVINPVNKVLTIITFIFACVTGYLLIKSVKREIKAKEDLQVANEKLKELDKQKTEFVSFATHQLRSPLTSIRGNASLILEGDAGPITDMTKGLLQTISISIKTMINVVEDYLNISRIELGTMKYDMVAMDFKDLVKEVVNEQVSNINDKGLSYSLTLDENVKYPIKADPDKFKQVIMNTIDNSIKYTPKGSLAFTLSKNPTNGMFRFEIADTGVGIDPKVMPKLFQKFSRADNAHEANIHGTGLGLYIAKGIVAAHGGHIWAESQGEGKGSQFYIELPEAR